MGITESVFVFLVPNYITTFRLVGTATYDGPEKVWEGAVMWCQTSKDKMVKHNRNPKRYSIE